VNVGVCVCVCVCVCVGVCVGRWVGGLVDVCVVEVYVEKHKHVLYVTRHASHVTRDT